MVCMNMRDNKNTTVTAFQWKLDFGNYFILNTLIRYGLC